ncbi:cannabinoid receptor 1-like [Montipora foliosa]|uniref:cannabinoid receptor 1-like n=1 Tax=Montipora foliosa TaxID=591990 RepID=UPI0035F1BCD9
MNATTNNTLNTFTDHSAEITERPCLVTETISKTFQLNYFYYSNFIFTPITGLLGLWCFLSNGSVLFVILRGRLHINAGLFTLCSLTLTDLIWAGLVVPLYLSFRVAELISGQACSNRSDWDNPVMVSAFFLCLFSTVGTLGVMSVDRYLAVSRPLWYKVHVNKRHTISACCAVWVISLSIVVLKQVEIFPRRAIELFEALYIGPIALLVIVFQVSSLVVLRRHNNAVANMNEGSAQVPNLISAIERQLVVVTRHVVALLGISIIPVSVLVVLSAITDIQLSGLAEPIYFPIATLCSGINPVLYYRGNDQIRQEITKIVKCH